MKPINTDILLIEDNPVDSTLFLKALRKYSSINKVEIAEKGNKALKMLFQLNIIPKIIILDLGLPDMNGLEVLKKIKEKKITKNIPVIVFSGSDLAQNKELAENYGVFEYFIKPVSYNQYIQCVKNITQLWERIVNKEDA